VKEIAQRLADADAIRRSRQFPYQYFAAYLSASQEVPLTGWRWRGATTQVRCADSGRFVAEVEAVTL
jgi:hypothetical protein